MKLIRHLGCASAAAALMLTASTATADSDPATRGAPSRSTVTIQADGTDLSGTVRSPRRACRANRVVIVIRQMGARGGEDDEPWASDTSQLVNGIGVWSTGNTGMAGRFYARVRPTAACKAAVSRTVRAEVE